MITTLATPRVAAVLLVPLLLATGCSQTTARPRIDGKVTFKGQAAGDLTLILYSEGKPADTFSKNFPVAPDGTFAGDISVPGTYKVVIAPSLASMEGHAPVGASALKIPPKYRDRTTTNLTWTIAPGDNHKDFDLTE